MSPWKITIALAGAPLAWIVQMSADEPLVSGACYPHAVPLPAPRWPSAPHLLLVISLLCLFGGIASAVLAWRYWREVRRQQDGTGRERFIALLGLLSSGLFTIAIIFTICANLLVPPC